jgi:hypothetical protein
MTWTARALVYSGRPDPTWRVDRATARRLLAIWDGLRPLAAAPPPPHGLGYRGVVLTDSSGTTWQAGGRAVRRTGGGRAPEARADTARRFEQALLRSAPAGLLPAGLDR